MTIEKAVRVVNHKIKQETRWTPREVIVGRVEVNTLGKTGTRCGSMQGQGMQNQGAMSDGPWTTQ